MEVQPGVYAIVGATAVLGAVFRSSISLVFIVVEGTRGIGEGVGRGAWPVLLIWLCTAGRGAPAYPTSPPPHPVLSPCRAAVWRDPRSHREQLGRAREWEGLRGTADARAPRPCRSSQPSPSWPPALPPQHLHRDGLYEAELDREQGSSCYYLRQEPPHALRAKTAEEIMASPPVSLSPVERVDTVLRVLRSTTHQGFPVVVTTKGGQREHGEGGGGEGGGGEGAAGESSSGRTAGRLQGFMLRSQVGRRRRAGGHWCVASGTLARQHCRCSPRPLSAPPPLPCPAAAGTAAPRRLLRRPRALPLGRCTPEHSRI